MSENNRTWSIFARVGVAGGDSHSVLKDLKVSASEPPPVLAMSHLNLIVRHVADALGVTAREVHIKFVTVVLRDEAML